MLLINNLSEKKNRHRNEILSAFTKVLDSAWFVLGQEIKHFESSFAAYLGEGACVSVANGTEAIELGLKVLGIKAGDHVATVANAGMYTTTALQAIGAVPVWLDVDLNHQCATLSEVVSAVAQKNVKCVVLTHLYGRVVPETEAIVQFCKSKNVVVLEDCAQAHGATLNHKKAGTFGDVSSFSFYPTKNLGALGDGGAVFTNKNQLAEELRLLRQYGWTSKYCVSREGARNSRLDEIQASFLSIFLQYLDEDNQLRRNIAGLYQTHIKTPLVQLPTFNDQEYVAHLYVIRCNQRDSLQSYLRKHDVMAEVHYPIPDYRQPIFGDFYRESYLNNTEILSQQILTLPCYPEMTTEEAVYVSDLINRWSENA